MKTKKFSIHSMMLFALTGITHLAIGQSWSLTGNTGTNPGSNFIGTRDNNNFKIRTNNVVRINVSTTGKVGLGNFAPAYKLDVKGSINTDSLYRIGGNAVLSVNGTNNTAVGIDALISNGSGIYNAATGSEALRINNSGNFNSAFGAFSLFNNQTGSRNVAVGTSALSQNTIANDNVAIGNESLTQNTEGRSNVGIGTNALHNNTNAGQNVAVGTAALQTQAYNNSGITWMSDNVGVGCEALYSNQPSSPVSGVRNTAIGNFTLHTNTVGYSNTACGYNALYSNTGSRNVAVGRDALYDNTSGDFNTAVGYFAGPAGASAYSNSTALGSQTITTASDQVRIGNAVTSIGGPQNWTSTSDARIKSNIIENVPGLEFINLLRPVTYNKSIEKENEIKGKKNMENVTGYMQYDKIRYTGFIAQEVEKSAKDVNFDFSGVDAPKNDHDLYGLRYAEFVVPLVKAVQELSGKNELKDAVIAGLQKQNDVLTSRLNKVEAMMNNFDLSLAECCNNYSSQQAQLKNQETNGIIDSPRLEQNNPNPFNQSAVINYFIPSEMNNAHLTISNLQGIIVKDYHINSNGNGQVKIDAGTLAGGVYNFSLIVDGKSFITKQMSIVK